MLIPIYECQKCSEQVITKRVCPECGAKDSVFMYYAEQVTDSNPDKCDLCQSEICTCWEDDA